MIWLHFKAERCVLLKTSTIKKKKIKRYNQAYGKKALRDISNLFFKSTKSVSRFRNV
jgi:hypothetical protein